MILQEDSGSITNLTLLAVPTATEGIGRGDGKPFKLHHVSELSPPPNLIFRLVQMS